MEGEFHNHQNGIGNIFSKGNIDFQYIIRMYVVSKVQAKKIFQEFIAKYIRQDAAKVVLTPHESFLETTHPIYKIIDEVIKPFPKPAIDFRDGIDSSRFNYRIAYSLLKTD